MTHYMVYVAPRGSGPILHVTAAAPGKVRAHVEKSAPPLRKKGYTIEWARTGRWHVGTVHNSRGTRVHEYAFRPVRKDEEHFLGIRAQSL